MLSRFATLATLGGHARARNLLLACGLAIGLVLASAAIGSSPSCGPMDISDAERELKNLSFILSEELDRRSPRSGPVAARTDRAHAATRDRYRRNRSSNR